MVKIWWLFEIRRFLEEIPYFTNTLVFQNEQGALIRRCWLKLRGLEVEIKECD